MVDLSTQHEPLYFVCLGDVSTAGLRGEGQGSVKGASPTIIIYSALFALANGPMEEAL